MRLKLFEAKYSAEDESLDIYIRAVEERSVGGEDFSVNWVGAYRSENVSMSSVKLW